MGNSSRHLIIEKARACWDKDQAFLAGGVIFESIPVNRRHIWAYKILELAYSQYPKEAKIETVLEFAKYPEKWGYGKVSRYRQAHMLVDQVNSSYSDPIIFQLAAQVGKIVYTSQQYPAPFDHGAGWEIATILKHIVREIKDNEFEKLAWSVFADADFIVLEEPVMCHPGCPTCIANGLGSIEQIKD
jgi:hypothetical protein